ncbi:GSCOCG00006543001-RA-CDS [Cotesia congregata]|uniref:Uncharacterized protein n=1 Tax=Cotesia congregata TaxID=51543 RepID=A0A8J2HNK7_COTCN|nr:GSCOCG00006543001-RA-CDS [Cotesia congregata]CAG5106434.1 Protein of unknown function [Cotesia congregata]
MNNNMQSKVVIKEEISGESDDIGVLSTIGEDSGEGSGDDSVNMEPKEHNETCDTCNDSTLDEPKEMLYIQARKKLNKVNRISKSTLPPAPRTPSKSGVIRESSLGKFKDIQAIFESKLFGNKSPSSSSSGPRIKLSPNNIGKKFADYFTLHKSPRRSLNFLDVDKATTSKFDQKDN